MFIEDIHLNKSIRKQTFTKTQLKLNSCSQTQCIRYPSRTKSTIKQRKRPSSYLRLMFPLSLIVNLNHKLPLIISLTQKIHQAMHSEHLKEKDMSSKFLQQALGLWVSLELHLHTKRSRTQKSLSSSSPSQIVARVGEQLVVSRESRESSVKLTLPHTQN